MNNCSNRTEPGAARIPRQPRPVLAGNSKHITESQSTWAGLLSRHTDMCSCYSSILKSPWGQKTPFRKTRRALRFRPEIAAGTRCLCTWTSDLAPGTDKSSHRSHGHEHTHTDSLNIGHSDIHSYWCNMEHNHCFHQCRRHIHNNDHNNAVTTMITVTQTASQS